MNDGINGDKYTVAQLKDWLQSLGLSTTGTKSALIQRINEVKSELRADPPTGKNQPLCEIVEIQTSNNNNEESIEGQQTFEVEITKESNNNNEESIEGQQKFDNTANGSSEENDSNVKEKVSNEDGVANEVSNEVKENATTQNYKVSNNASNVRHNEERCTYNDRLIELARKENELLRKEKELLAAENELLKKLSQANMNTVKPIKTGMITNESFNTIKELVPEFDGTTPFETWKSQVKCIIENFGVNENAIRALIANKVKKDVQTWLFSKPNYMAMSVNDLFDEMQVLFGSKETKLTLRKKFEQRKWTTGESFAKYFNEKMTLANGVNIEKDELIDFLIEGIPEPQLRSQAHLQCFTNELQLLQAFAKLELRTRNVTTASTIRCYNCNSAGHMASECRKPKRQEGACFVCNSMSHRAIDCPQHKGKISALDKKNDYTPEAQ